LILKYLFIKHYKKFEEIEINFCDNSNNGSRKLMSELYGNMNFTVLVGENGVGKTTILSFIAHVFKNLQRFHNRIPSDFKMIYQLYENEDVVIEKIEEDIFITVDGTRKLLLEFDGKSRTYIGEKSGETVTYDDIVNKLPANVIVSCFDVDYPKNYNWNYVGHKLIKIKSVDEIYKTTGFGMDISLGIIEFLIKYFYEDNRLEKFFMSLGFLLSEDLHIYRNFSVYDDNKFNFFEDFYDDEGYNSWEEFLKCTSFNSENDFIDYVMSEDFWSEYCEEIIDDESNTSSSSNEKFNFKKFVEGNSFNIGVLYRLILNDRLYINEFFIKKGSEILSLNKMSTGEKIYLCRLFFLLSEVQDDSLVILEEPEIHLNYSWVKQLITVMKLLFDEYKTHFLISTHNNAFINMLFPENILILEDDTIKNPEFNTFLANEKEINRKLFKNSNVKNVIEKEILSMIETSNKDELEYIMSNLGESYFKYMLFKRLNEIGDRDVESDK
jgi:predicted ATPase